MDVPMEHAVVGYVSFIPASTVSRGTTCVNALSGVFLRMGQNG